MVAAFPPADAVETAEARQLGLETRTGPSPTVLSEQPAHPVRRKRGVSVVARGYVLRAWGGAETGVPDLTLVATGIAVEAAETLAAGGSRIAVVPLPCWALLAEQAVYRAEGLGAVPRIAVEATLSFGWVRWLREGNRLQGMEDLGPRRRAASGSPPAARYG